MTVPGAPTALMVVSVWIGSGATAVAACLALLESGVRGTSMSASPTPAALRAAWTAYSSPTTTFVSAAVPSLVRASPASQPLWMEGALSEEIGLCETCPRPQGSFSYI